jgi:hypothetical protein
MPKTNPFPNEDLEHTDDEASTLPEVYEDVGYRKPPSDTRFRKGVSGNPKGRPKGSLNVATLLMKTLRERVILNENGQRKTVTKLEAALKQLVNKAASGDSRALKQLVELARDAEAKQDLAGRHTPLMNQLDQQVMEDILQRFKLDEDIVVEEAIQKDDFLENPKSEGQT